MVRQSETVKKQQTVLRGAENVDHVRSHKSQKKLTLNQLSRNEQIHTNHSLVTDVVNLSTVNLIALL